MTQVIVLNGGSSSGKTGIARCLQAILPGPWLRLGVDDLVGALPPSLLDSGPGIAFGQRGEVAAMARAGARVIIDDVFLSGAASQQRTRAHLAGLDVLWAGVHCDPGVVAAREIARGDRVTGMAASQAAAVHDGVVYDVEVDTSHTEPMDCARAIALHVT